MVIATEAPLTVSARIARAWDVLDGVLDPEVPALSVRDLGIVRDVRVAGDPDRHGAGVERNDGRDLSADPSPPPALEVVLTPTYSGCPATEVIEQSVLQALEEAGLGPVRATLQRAPAWTSDWISADGHRKLRDYGIAPPGPVQADAGVVIRIVRKTAAVACPRCGSEHTERLSAFGSTACKALYRCLDCREPFEYFKPI